MVVTADDIVYMTLTGEVIGLCLICRRVWLLVELLRGTPYEVSCQLEIIQSVELVKLLAYVIQVSSHLLLYRPQRRNLSRGPVLAAVPAWQRQQ